MKPQIEAELNTLFDESSFDKQFLFDHKMKVKFKLNELLSIAKQEVSQKYRFFAPKSHYSLFSVSRKRKQNQILGDYPHHFKMINEATGQITLSAIQQNESGDFLIFQGQIKRTHHFIKYGQNYIGLLKSGFWGTSFQLFDYGLPRQNLKKLPKKLLSVQKKIMKITYERNILGECPRALQAQLYDLETGKLRLKLQNIEPEYNESRGCYTLNFHGRAIKASARNFQMRQSDDEETVVLMHGKVNKNLFNLDYRNPLSMVQAFAISLASISKKRLVS